MPTTVPSRVIAVLALCLVPLHGAEPETAYTRIAKLASYISAGDTVGALEAFDKSLKDYSAIAANLGALAVQTETLCSIDVVTDKEADNATADVHHLDLDWYMMLKSLADPDLIERRRQIVTVTIQRFKSSWRITEMSPAGILAPITIK